MITETKKVIQKKSKTNLGNDVKDYGSDPFFVKKAKASKKFLEKRGFPKEIVGNK